MQIVDEISNKIKEQRFKYPDAVVTGFGRKLACVKTENAFWVAAQMEYAGNNQILLKKFSNGQSESLVTETAGYPHQPALMRLSDNRIIMVWNESNDDGWKIQSMIIGEDHDLSRPCEIATVWSSENLCLPPAVTFADGKIIYAWPAMDDDNDIRIFISINGGMPEAVSDVGIDAMRPVLATVDKQVVLAWDQYRNDSYEIAVMQLMSDGIADKPNILGKSNERWMCPVLTALDEQQKVYMSWLGLRELSDDLGIADHFPFGMAAEITSQTGVKILEDKTNQTYPAIIADLREGILAEHVYKGYLGLRRRPQVTVSDTGELYYCWEARIESESTAVLGHLVIRKYSSDTGWSQPVIICSEGYGYTVPPKFTGNKLPVGYFRFKETGEDILHATSVDVKNGKPYEVDSSKWKRWHKSEIKSLEKPREIFKVQDKEYKLFWADTHCHSNFSADAEGEPDEIIHFARDVAKLDALCVIDNDFYPNKTLSQAEWRIHNAYAEHFTKAGEFVLFPGFEFTFHRADLSPDFNHRCVIYPRSVGKLLRRIDSGSRNDRELLESLSDTSAMAYPHHCSYEIVDPAKEWNIEALSSWRICLAESDFTIKQLQAGRRLGFIGSSDAHRYNPGMGGALTGLFAEELTPESLFDAYRNRRLIATQGFAVFIDFRVSGIFIGSEGQSSEPPLVKAMIKAPEPIEYVEIIRDGEIIFKNTPDGKEMEFEFRDDSANSGKHFYFLKLKLQGDSGVNFNPDENSKLPFTLDSKYPHNLAKARGVFAWTSPVWITVS